MLGKPDWGSVTYNGKEWKLGKNKWINNNEYEKEIEGTLNYTSRTHARYEW